MSEIIIVRRRMPVRRAFRFLCVFVSAQVIALSALAATDDSFLFLLSHTNTVGSLVTKVIQQVTDAIGITTSNSSGGASGSAGIDENLVNQMSEGIAKDYLKICLKNEKGELDTKKREMYMGTTTIIGKNAVESGFTNIKGNATVVPDTDIPGSLIDAGKYGTGNVSLYKWNSKTRSGGTTDVGGPLAFTGDNVTWTGLDTKSIYNKSGTHTDNGVGDGWFFPDAVAACNTYMESAISGLDVTADDLNSIAYGSDIAAIGACIDHNCGKGWYDEMLYGVCYLATGYIGKKDSKETIERANVVASDVHSVSDDFTTDQLNLISGRKDAWISDMIMIKAGWFIDSHCKDWLMQHAGEAGRKFWNTLFPDNKVSNNSEFGKALDAYVRTPMQITGYSAVECDKLFGTTDGSYFTTMLHKDSSYKSKREYGILFKLLDGTTNALKGGKNAKRLIALNALGFQSAGISVAVGLTIAKRMMIYAGVSNDLVDKMTATVASENTVNEGTASFKANSKTLETLKSHGCDISKLNNGRYKVLAAAIKMNGTQYKTPSGYNHNKCSTFNHPYYDCSAFVSHAICGSGIDDVSSFGWVPTWTGGYPRSGNNNHFSYKPYPDVGLDGLLPGDIMCRGSSTHVLIYVGKKSGVINTLEAMGSNSPTNGWHTRSSLTSTFYVYRLKGYYAPTDGF